MGIVEQLRAIAERVQREFEEERRVLSFGEYLELFAADPVNHSRDAARYLRDAFDHYGRVEVERPWGKEARYRLFDLPFLEESERRREALVGQEAVQGEIYRALHNFVREGRANRLILLHGPNGSAKSTVAACMMRALEHYSTESQGALYRFHWVFPNEKTMRGSIGFGGARPVSSAPGDSFAHLPEQEIDARLFMEVRDHPLFLLPREERRVLLGRLYEEVKAKEPPPAWMLRGELSHKSRQVYDALLTTYQGSLERLLRHVQVERYFISRRYRIGAVTLGPQLSVDAGERQVTADRSLGALPTSLQAVTLFEAFGELVDAAGGLLEFSDLLKRPLDAFKYLQMTAETGQVPLRTQTLEVNCVMLASGNELHLSAFHEHPEFESFRGRFEFVRAPYLLSWLDEQAIYDAQVAAQVQGHVAPHATQLVSMFAVLTRLRRPNPERYTGSLRELVADLTVVEKMDLYATGTAPQRLDDEERRLIEASVAELYEESRSYPIYEGSVGASPREMRVVLLDAAHNARFACLSPFAVLDELDELCTHTSDYAFLQESVLTGGYHDHELFRRVIRERLLDALEDEFRIASGLVDEARYKELFDRYVTHVSFFVKGERIRNSLTGQYEQPDERLMREVEGLLGVTEDVSEFRPNLISTIAAWSIDNPNRSMDNTEVFPGHLRRLREAVFGELRVTLAQLCRDVLILLRESGAGLDDGRRRAAERVVSLLVERFGYQETSAADAAAALFNDRLARVLP